jgi:hypothetical protein
MSLKRRRNKIIGMAIISMAISFSTQGQVPGCTDSLALNFNPLAVVNDGSCLFDSQPIFATTIADPMSSIVGESSGLLFHDGSLWTINDSGNEPELYRLDPTNGLILKTIMIDNSILVDWEGLASDGVHLYIGDFGNNDGSRTDLGIYKVPWEPILQSIEDTTVESEFIAFSYSDQTDFTPLLRNTDYDCEAILFHSDSLHLFSKNWIDNKTRHYRIPTTPGTYEAALIDSFDVQGLITDASIRPLDDVIVLLGYTDNIQPFMYLLNDFPEGAPLGGNKRRLLLPEHSLQQAEGVAFDDSLSVFFTREFNFTGPGLYHTDLTSVLHPNGIVDVEEETFSATRSNGQISLLLRSKMKSEGRIAVYDITGNNLAIERIPKGLKTIILADPEPHQILVISVEEKGDWSKAVLVAKPLN